MTREDILQMAHEADEYVDRVLSPGEFHPDKHDVRDIHFADLVAAAEKELIAQWVESWGNDLTIKEIVEGIRTNGNGATRPLKYVTREEPL